MSKKLSKSVKRERLCWIFANDERREYLSGRYMIPGNSEPIWPQGIKAMTAPESAVGACLLLLITPLCFIETGEVVKHELRGSWAGSTWRAVNSKRDRESFKAIEASYRQVNVDCIEYLREYHEGWDQPLHEYVSDDYHVRKPGVIIEENCGK